jgi:hypothetical protein
MKSLRGEKVERFRYGGKMRELILRDMIRDVGDVCRGDHNGSLVRDTCWTVART